jgi:hypothetical protein
VEGIFPFRGHQITLKIQRGKDSDSYRFTYDGKIFRTSEGEASLAFPDRDCRIEVVVP